MSWEMPLNTALTVAESLYNFVGYLPKSKKTTQQVAESRAIFGQALAGAGVLTAVVSFAIGYFKKDSAEVCKEITTKGLYYAGHGALNYLRAQVERTGAGAFTLAYDLVGQKLLPYTNVNPSFDIQSRAFAWIKMELNKVNISEIIPALIKKVTG